MNGIDIQSVFYAQELQKVSCDNNTEYRIEKVLEKKGKGPKLQYFVKLEGYPDSFNSWIAAS